MNTIYKTARLPDDFDIDKGIEFVVSTTVEDAVGDSIDQSKWDLRRFKSNPIVLFNHAHAMPVGRAEETGVKSGALKSRIFLADAGTSEAVDTLRKLVAQKIIRAVSAGFLPTKDPEIKRDKAGNFTGLHFVGQELVEISLCAVPSNPQTLATFKSFELAGKDFFADLSVMKATETRARQLVLIRLGVPSKQVFAK